MSKPLDFTGLDIQEAFSHTEGKALTTLVSKVAHPFMLIVEVGSWKGFSTAYLATGGKRYKAAIYAIDHWKGNPGTSNIYIAEHQSIYEIFIRNMVSLDFYSMVTTICQNSISASRLFANGSIDLIFLDADHRYTPFKADLEAWIPKLRPGGILCGHDCDPAIQSLSPDLWEEAERCCEEDFIMLDGSRSWGFHPGVALGLRDIFKGKYKHSSGSLWYWVKPRENITYSVPSLKETICTFCARCHKRIHIT